MSSAPTPEQIARDATWLAQAYDPEAGRVRLVAMDSQAYRNASFLDDRMLQQTMTSHIVDWQKVRSALAIDARTDARWIFHIGHVGSTLVARLLGEIDGVLAIREPRFLRDLAGLGNEDRSHLLFPAQALFSRTFAENQLALVKATSFVSEIADELVPPGERALFLFAKPRAYIASILAGENSVKELAALAGSRARRMSGRVPALGGTTTADAAAAAWADFDAMLGDMPNELIRLAQFFGFAATAERLHAVATGLLMARYSKALEYDYSPALRRDLIAEADAAHRVDIESALAMLGRAAEKSPLLARALARSGES